MRKQLLIAAVLMLGLAGCSSIPSGGKFAGVDTMPGPGESVFYIYRPDAYFGKAITVAVLLNGKKVADLGNEGFFPLVVKAGQYTIQPESDAIDHEFKFNAVAGETVFLRLKVNRKPALCFCTSLEFERADRSRAMNELA